VLCPTHYPFGNPAEGKGECSPVSVATLRYILRRAPYTFPCRAGVLSHPTAGGGLLPAGSSAILVEVLGTSPKLNQPRETLQAGTIRLPDPIRGRTTCAVNEVNAQRANRSRHLVLLDAQSSRTLHALHFRARAKCRSGVPRNLHEVRRRSVSRVTTREHSSSTHAGLEPKWLRMLPGKAQVRSKARPRRRATECHVHGVAMTKVQKP